MEDRPIILLGDIHGDLDKVRAYLAWHKITDCVVVQVGDFGYSLSNGLQTEAKYLGSLQHYNKFFKTRNITFYAIRGNHDDPSYFDGRFLLSNLRLLPDYTVLELGGKRWLFVGGALSIDRLDRQNEMKHRPTPVWWLDEKFVLDKDKALAAGAVDVVVTHTAPECACTYELVGRGDLLKRIVQEDGDHELPQDLAREQASVQALYDLLRINGSPLMNWYHGHFHKSTAVDYKETRFRCLGVNEFREHR
jgi:predicted phosphodiesterase